MQISLFAKTAPIHASYVEWRNCPLCGGAGLHRDSLTRSRYRFGHSLIPLPPSGVELRECGSCGLLYKSAVPDADSLDRILSAEAHHEWSSKPGEHPSVARIRPFLVDDAAVLDIGASTGDLLRGLAPYCGRLSAFDAVRYPACEAAVTGEYIIGSFETAPSWSGDAYDVVTAFDVFEHFLDPRAAIRHTIDFLKPGGHLVIETGNWPAARSDLASWYYCNLVEHQIFWSEKSLRRLCDAFDLELIECDAVNHKYRRDMPAAKRLAISAYRQAARFDWSRRLITSAFGIDPRLLSPPGYEDHLFAVLRRKERAPAAAVAGPGAAGGA